MATITTKTERIITRYRQTLEQMGIRVTGVFLYGSRASGRPHEGSDIDLIIVSEDFKKMSLLERMEILGIASGRISEPVQSYGFTPEEIKSDIVPSFLNEVLKSEAISI